MASAGKQTKLNFTATRPRPVIKKETQSLNRPTTTGHTKTVEQVEAELNFLRQFDLNLKYGPCLGMSRLERWERAQRFGLSPPVEIPAEQGQTYASEVNAIFAETSALTARNVEEMFIEITRKLPPDCLTSLPAGASLLRQTDTPRAKGGCCGGGGGDKGPS